MREVICVCVCVCEREKEREREKPRRNISEMHFILLYDEMNGLINVHKEREEILTTVTLALER